MSAKPRVIVGPKQYLTAISIIVEFFGYFIYFVDKI
jgi:hypothetical protein